MAERFHCLPQDVRDMPEADYRRILLFMGAETEARKLKDDQARHYGR